MEENTELITFVGGNESESKSKFEDVELSCLEEKVDLKNLVIYPSESYLNERLEHLNNLLCLEQEKLFKKYGNFLIKNAPLENEINNDKSEKELPDDKYEKSPLKFSTNVLKEQKIKDLFCFLCSLQFDGKRVYDMHQTAVHNYRKDVNFVKNFIKTEIIKEKNQVANLNLDEEIVPTNGVNTKIDSVDKSKTSNSSAEYFQTNQIRNKSELETDVNKIKPLLVDQIISRVRWRESVDYMMKQGVTEFLEIGPGKVLSGLVKKINGDVKTSNINSMEDIVK